MSLPDLTEPNEGPVMNRPEPAPSPGWLQNTVERRFGVQVEHEDPELMTASMSLPAYRFAHPLTAARAMGPISFIVDGSCGLVNHYNRLPNSFAITAELSIDLVPELAMNAREVVARARLVGASKASSLSACTLTADGVEIGVGTVRSVYVPAEEFGTDRVPEWLDGAPEAGLLDLLQLDPFSGGSAEDTLSAATFAQRPDPVLNNTMGIVHGGVVATTLDVAAHYALGRVDEPMVTASMKVNYLRPMTLGEHSRYDASVIRAGRTSGVCDARAFDGNNRLAAVARVMCR